VSFVERNGFLSIPPLAPSRQKDSRRPHVSDPLTGAQTEAEKPIEPQAVSGDPATGYQWHHRVIRKTASLGTLSTTPPTIAIIDTGVDYSHSDLAGKVIRGKNCIHDNFDPFDDHGHGTHVAGLAAATAANGQYGEGVSHFSKILAIKVLDEFGSGTFFQVACGMHFGHQASTSPVTRVGNMSIGGPESELIATEVDHWKTAGKLLIVAAGNGDYTGDGSFNVDPDIGLRVMATQENDCRTFFSNFSPSTNPTLFNIAAPGWELPSTLPDERFGPLSGTSMASPVVAGTSALVWGQFPSLTRTQVIARLINNGRATTCGFAVSTPRVDVRRAIFQNAETVVIGRVLDGATAKPPSPPAASATIQVRNGTTVLGSGTKDQGGGYSARGSAIAGTGRSLFLTGMTGYLNDTMRQPLTVLTGTPSGPLTDAISKSRPTGYFHGTIDWKTAQPSLNDALVPGQGTKG
jgi:subtilisin family serine protease